MSYSIPFFKRCSIKLYDTESMLPIPRGSSGEVRKIFKLVTCQYIYGSLSDQICLKTDQICLNHFLKWFFGIMAKQLIRQTALTTDEEVYD